MRNDLLIAAGLGLLSGMFYIALSLGPQAALFRLLVLLPLFAVGLGYGLQALIVSLIAGSLVSLLATGLFSASIFALENGAVTLVICRQAMLWRQTADGTIHWYPAGRLVAWLTAIGILVGLRINWQLQGSEELQAHVTDMVSYMLAQFGNTSPDLAQRTAAATIRLLPAVGAFLWMLVAAMNGVLAQGLLAQFNRNRRPSPVFRRLALPPAMAWLLIAGVALALFGGEIGVLGASLAIVLSFAFLLQGLALLHTVAARIPQPAFFLVGSYVVLVLFFNILGPLITLAGFLETWLKLRRRLMPGGSEEDD
ncbi:DUF2232 domain-containing protein [Oceanibacterium hippocampi]|uniref:DUF2232 domain-containing protein n=1 Tax=Oceanibacterium hippocampi TaxID=745714 RepID=A0A1Y5SVV2_9PROT|nr:DUF2232 domain-containing protein [Oceanibacterium hippocampi]SLN48154.1 hypothetical protein OCH7691_02079 [Oceanibacterium hippocampi]